MRLVKRGEISRTKKVIIHASSIVLAFLVAAVFIYIYTKHNPLSVYAKMIEGAFGSQNRIKQVVIKAVPFTLASLGVAAAFKMKFWNIGGEGQIIMGAFAASFFALRFSHLPQPILLTVMAVSAIIMGGLWALIPAFLKAQWKTNETIITLMLNYIALKFITYLQYGPWRDPKVTGFPKIPNFSDSAILPRLFGIHMGWVIAIVMVIIMYVFMKHSKLGYETEVLGESERTAQYAGINIKKTILTVMLISGGLCGLAGMIEASAVCNTLSVDVTGGAGNTAIIISWLSSLSAPVIMVVSVLFAVLVQGAAYIQIAFNIPAAIAQMLQGTILFFVLGSEMFIQYRLVTNKKMEQIVIQEINPGTDAVSDDNKNGHQTSSTEEGV